MPDLSLVQYLQSKIADYVDSKRYQSLMTLSDRSGVPYNTIRRIANGQVDKPNFETVLAILRIVEHRSQVLATVRSYYPELAEFLSETSDTASYQTAKQSQRMLELLIEDTCVYRILCLASTRHGTTLECISRLLGDSGVAKLQTLIDEGVLYLDEQGMIRSNVADIGSQELRSLRQKLRHGLDMFDENLLGTDGGYIAAHCESLNYQGIRSLKRACKEFSATVARICSDDRYAGAIPFYTNIILGLLDPESLARRPSHPITNDRSQDTAEHLPYE